MASETKLKVCIIGAGAAGLNAARHLMSQHFQCHIYEQTNLIGGTWNYTDHVGVDENGLPIHSSMYKNLRTNLPIEIMAFPDFPSSNDTSFVHHTQVLEYLHNYAKHYSIEKIIKFDHMIRKVSRTDNNWSVVVEDIKLKTTLELSYDAIVVCNGTYATPKIPNINGLEKFKGRIIHSHDYRVADDFKGERVLVLGAGPSGIDIAIEMSQECTKVILNHHLKKDYINLPENIIQEKDSIQEVRENEVVMESGTCYTLDTILFATGYHHNYKFLDTNCNIKVKNARVDGVYLHFINTTHPTMAIMGIQCTVIPFAIYDQQMKLFAKSLIGEVELPCREDMNLDTQEDLKQRSSLGLPERHAHHMFGKLQWEYDDKLALIANIKPIRKVVRDIYDFLAELRNSDVVGYKDYNFVIESDTQYRVKNIL